MRKNILLKFKKQFPLFLVLIVVVLVSLPLTKSGYFPMHDDIQVMRLFEMERCFKDGQIPCRWTPDMGAGFGHPLFNYHPVFPYYLGMVFRMFSFSFLTAAKLLFFLSFLLSGIFMYFLAKEFFGRWPGAVAACLYVLVPYHALDIYVRGALTEIWALSILPLVLFSVYKSIKTKEFSFFLLSIFSLFVLFLSHNITTMIFAPIAFVWGLIWIFQLKKKEKTVLLLTAFAFAFGSASFFLIPAFFEKSLVTIGQQNSGYYSFHDHFATLKQLFLDRSWGYGPSRIGPNDDLSFQIGWPYWQLGLIAVAVFLYQMIKRKKVSPAVPFFVILLLISIFMTHAKSVFVWKMIPLLSFVQFPWRFLGITALASSFLVAILLSFLKRENWQVVIGVFLVIISLFFNLNYFSPERYDLAMTDEKKLTGIEWQIQSRATLLDYVPVGVKTIPEDLAFDNPQVLEGEANITGFQKRSNFWRFTVEVIGDQDVLVEVPVFDFTVWKIYVDSEEVNYQINPETGLIQVRVPKNKRTVTGWLTNTPLRNIANALTVLSFISLIILIVYEESKSSRRKK